MSLRTDQNDGAITDGAIYRERISSARTEALFLALTVMFFLRYGGAGIHFMSIRGRYRASFNFLEYPRVVIAL
mgnify:CR=1 FL=1